MPLLEMIDSPIMKDLLNQANGQNNIEYWVGNWKTLFSLCSTIPHHKYVEDYKSNRWTFNGEDYKLSLFKPDGKNLIYGVAFNMEDRYSVFKLEKSNWGKIKK